MKRLSCLITTLAWLAAFMVENSMADTLFTKEEILKFSPRAKPELVTALIDNQDALVGAGITTRLRVAHFLAQLCTETGGLRRIDENMNYSARRLLQVFSRRTISAAKAREIERKPRKIANWVYGNRLGNRGRNTEDGWNYRGSGYIQLTGRTNYRLRGNEVDLPLEATPELVRQPREGLLAATAYWKAAGINRPADLNDRLRVRKLVNGPAAHGFNASKLWFNRIWTRVFRNRNPAANEGSMVESTQVAIVEEATVGAILEEKGFLQAGAVEAGLGTETYTDGLRKFQASRNIPETGIMDEETLYTITDPDEWRGDPQEEASLSVENPETSVAFNAKVDTGVETATPQISLPPNEGTGTVETNTNLTPDELSVLAASGGTYAEYEMVGGRYDNNDNFVPFTVIGDDDRIAVLNTLEFPNRAIVQILFKNPLTGGSHMCSGTMISPNVVLTAGHCVHSGTRHGRWYAEWKVFPGRNTASKPFGDCLATRVFALKGWVAAADNHEARDFDLGALKLDCEVGNRTGWFGVKALTDDSLELETTVQGYAGDKAPAGRQWISKDKFRVLHVLKAFYQNDTFGGTSGSAVFSKNDHHIICVHTNGLHNGTPWNANNACTRITNERLVTINGWINDK